VVERRVGKRGAGLGHTECSLCDVSVGLREVHGWRVVQDSAAPGNHLEERRLSHAVGPNSIVVTSDGKQSIFVGAMWWQGIWRYVEP